MRTEVRAGRYAATPGELPEGTLVRLFFDALELGRPDALAGKRGGRWVPVSHEQLEADVRRLATALRELGLERGDRIGLLSENRPEWALADFAALCAGALDVPVYPTLPPNQIAYILEDCGARAVFVSTADQLRKIMEIKGELPELERIIVFDDVASDDPSVLTLARALEIGAEAAPDPAAFRERALETRPDELATILYTSGTTGPPKGVMLTHNNIYSNVQAVSGILDMAGSDVALSLLPLSHIFERMVDYVLFAHGVRIAYAESLEKVPDNLQEVRPTIVASTPRMYEKIYGRVMSASGAKRLLVNWAARVGERRVRALLDEGRAPGVLTRMQYGLLDRLVFAKLRERTGGRIRFFVSGGAPLSAEIARFFYSAGILILEGYGLTETSPVTNCNTEEDFRFGTVGKPVPGTETAIADDGEVLVRGPQVMKGYFNQPAATREVIDEEGWFHTGDVGEIDADGYLRITDRKKDLIVTAGGKNIAPQPIENQLKMNRYVAEAVMIGDRRPYPILLVVPAMEPLLEWARNNDMTGTEPDRLVRDERVRSMIESELRGVLEGLARFERPKKIALLSEEFTVEAGELTPTLKVKRRVVEQKFSDLIESLYAEEAAAGAD